MGWGFVHLGHILIGEERKTTKKIAKRTCISSGISRKVIFLSKFEMP
jgi:hypothetical protein